MPAQESLAIPLPTEHSYPLDNLFLHSVYLPPQDLHAEILSGLKQQQKKLSPKYFYDQAGSNLFEKITTLPEYYPTRTEQHIFEQSKHEMFEALGERSILIEPGSGGCHKIQPLLNATQAQAYVPIEISEQTLYDATRSLATQHPNTDFHAICADFTQSIKMPEQVPDENRTIFFPGSTIGNFNPEDAIALLNRFRKILKKGGKLLIGVDTKKEHSMLEAAYNDAEGITAAFNLNALHHLNQKFHCNFAPDTFEHVAFYNEKLGRIEMHLRSLSNQDVSIGSDKIHFEKNETLHTENSYKYTPKEFCDLAEKSGFSPAELWQDDNKMFSVHLMEAT